MLVFHALLTLFMLAVFYYDSTRYIIPNWICGILLALYPAMLLATPDPLDATQLLWGVGMCLLLFAVGIIIFAMKWAGGGDVKLLAVLGLWTGREATLEMVIFTGLIGGGLALLLLAARPVCAYFVPVEKAGNLPRVLRDGEPLPYGLAITVSFLLVLWDGIVPGLPL